MTAYLSSTSGRPPGSATASPSRRATTAWNLFFNAISIVLAVTSGVVLVPLYLHYIPSDLYGAWQASGNVLVWITMLDPGISAVVQQRVASAHGARDSEAIVEWIGSGFVLSAGISILVLAAGLIGSLFLSSLMRLPADFNHTALASAFRWSVTGSALMILAYAVQGGALQSTEASRCFGGAAVAVLVLRIVLVVVFLTRGFGLLGIALPSVITGILLLVLDVVCLRANLRREGIRFCWRPTRLRPLARLLAPSALGKSAGILANNIDLLLVARLLGPESVNTLRFTRTAPEISRMLVERPAVAMQSPLSHLVGERGPDSARAILLRLLRLIIWLLTLLASGFVLFNGDFIRLWVGSDFYAGTTVNVLLVAGFVGSCAMSVLSTLCFAAGNIRGNGLSAMAQALVYLPLLWAGGHWYGMSGVAAATVLSLILTQGWYMPLALLRIYRVTDAERVRLAMVPLQAVLSAVVPAVLLSRVHPASWFSLGAWVATFTGCYVLMLLLLCREARAELRSGRLWIRRRVSSLAQGKVDEGVS